MKALSLWQPWASAIACGAKRIETRSWATSYRGPIAIHAAKKWDRELREDALMLCREQRELSQSLNAIGINRLSDFPLGAVVCTANLLSCAPTEYLVKDRGISALEEALGNYTPGRFGWILTDIKPLAKPVPVRGYQQLWEWD
jgi:hypothetical protein